MTTWWDNNSSAAGEINNSRVQNASFVDDFSDGDYDDDGASTAQGPQNISQQQNPTRKLQWQDSDLSEMSVDEATPHQSTPGSKSIKLQEKSSPVFENSLWQSSSADLAASDSGSQERDDFANPIFESTKEWEEGEMPGEEEMELVEDLPMSWEEIDEDELKVTLRSSKHFPILNIPVHDHILNVSISHHHFERLPFHLLSGTLVHVCQRTIRNNLMQKWPRFCRKLQLD